MNYLNEFQIYFNCTQMLFIYDNCLVHFVGVYSIFNAEKFFSGKPIGNGPLSLHMLNLLLSKKMKGDQPESQTPLTPWALIKNHAEGLKDALSRNCWVPPCLLLYSSVNSQAHPKQQKKKSTEKCRSYDKHIAAHPTGLHVWTALAKMRTCLSTRLQGKTPCSIHVLSLGCTFECIRDFRAFLYLRCFH